MDRTATGEIALHHVHQHPGALRAYPPQSSAYQQPSVSHTQHPFGNLGTFDAQDPAGAFETPSQYASFIGGETAGLGVLGGSSSNVFAFAPDPGQHELGSRQGGFQAQHQQRQQLQHRQSNGSQFGILGPGPHAQYAASTQSSQQQHRIAPRTPIRPDQVGALHQQQDDEFPGMAQEEQTKNSGHLEGLKMIPNPPDLQAWRERLFNVEDTIVMTEDEFQTYFPHIDNVYSHRSTQRYKRKPFISHYWDCRLKGRPPGTPKSDDPSKKKRKRTARERDLCDVKIKLTEYLPGAAPPEVVGMLGQGSVINAERDANNFFAQGQPGDVVRASAPWSVSTLSPTGPAALPQQNLATGSSNSKVYTIQRVNGNGGNGKADGVGGPHRHTLEESDRVKKNSVVRWMAKSEKERKKTTLLFAAAPRTASYATRRDLPCMRIIAVADAWAAGSKEAMHHVFSGSSSNVVL